MKVWRLCSRCSPEFTTLKRRKNVQIQRISSTRSYYYTAPNILFFGSDNFSVHTLDRLLQQKKEEPGLYNSLHVITREPAPSGRGLLPRKGDTILSRQLINPVPIQVFAENLNIPLTTVDKSTILELHERPEFDKVNL